MEAIDEVIAEISALIRSEVAPSEQPKYNNLIRILKEDIKAYEVKILSQSKNISNLNTAIIDKDNKLNWANSKLDLQLNEIKRKERLLKSISDLMIDQTKDV